MVWLLLYDKRAATPGLRRGSVEVPGKGVKASVPCHEYTWTILLRKFIE